MKRLLIVISLILGCASLSFAQQWGLKTNAVYWGTTTPNLAVEAGLGPKTTIELAGGYNPFTLNKENNVKVKHWMVMPEFRYWLCERFNGHFFGLHAGYMLYNVGGIRIPFKPKETRNYRYEGWAAGAGFAYGYSWILGKRWNIEAEIGVGYAYTDYDRYECKVCGYHRGTEARHYFGPTKLGLSIIYFIK